MAKIGVTSRDLFGSIDDLSTSSEYFVLSKFFDQEIDMISRTEWCFEYLPIYQSLLLDLEDAALMDEALNAYIFGLYASVVLLSDALCERILTDAIESQGDFKSARSGFGRVLRSVENFGLLDPYIIGRVGRLHNIRNNMCHEKGPENDYRLFRRALVNHSHHSDIMKNDAKEALCIARGLSAKIERNFPRLNLPGVGIFAGDKNA